MPNGAYKGQKPTKLVSILQMPQNYRQCAANQIGTDKSIVSSDDFVD
jgi:hypothetical protein